MPYWIFRYISFWKIFISFRFVSISFRTLQVPQIFKVATNIVFRFCFYYTCTSCSFRLHNINDSNIIMESIKINIKRLLFILSSSKELTSWVKLQVEIFCKTSCSRALQKICTCSLTHDVSSLKDDNVFVFCLAIF